MKKRLKLTLLTSVLASVITSCGSAPQMNMQTLTAQPMQAQNAPALRAQNNITTQYWLGDVVSSHYDPDTNNSHFGFDYLNITYTAYSSLVPNRLSMTYAQQGNSKPIMMSVVKNVGTPEQVVENIQLNDTPKIQELNFFMATLMTRSETDKANLQRALNKFALILGQPPRQPQMVGGPPQLPNFPIR